MTNTALSEVNSQDEHTAHILVVDDDTRIRTLLQRYLIENNFRVTTAGDAAAAREYLRSLQFDLLILDIMMPGEDGLSLAKSLRSESDVPILLLTARGDIADRIIGFEHGADDYIPKPFEPRELVLRIQAILKRAHEPVIDRPRELRMGEARFDFDRDQLWLKDELIRLTDAERTLLRLFAENPGEAFSRLDLCEKIGVSQERSIDVQVTRLRRKIEPDPKLPLYLQTVRGIGYRLIPD